MWETNRYFQPTNARMEKGSNSSNRIRRFLHLEPIQLWRSLQPVSYIHLVRTLWWCSYLSSNWFSNHQKLSCMNARIIIRLTTKRGTSTWVCKGIFIHRQKSEVTSKIDRIRPNSWKTQRYPNDAASGWALEGKFHMPRHFTVLKWLLWATKFRWRSYKWLDIPFSSAWSFFPVYCIASPDLYLYKQKIDAYR